MTDKYKDNRVTTRLNQENLISFRKEFKKKWYLRMWDLMNIILHNRYNNGKYWNWSWTWNEWTTK